jgi:sec-independent protein translocase protein TatA
MFSGLESPTHLLLVLVIVLLLFGAKRLPEMGRNLGRGIKEFREGLGGKEVPEKNRAAVEKVEEKAGTETTRGKKKTDHTNSSERGF